MLIGITPSGATEELVEIRESAIAAFEAALVPQPDRAVIIGAGLVTEAHSGGWGSLRGFGVPYDVALNPGDQYSRPSGRRLPLSLTVGAWLLEQVDWPGERIALEVDAASTDDELDMIGRLIGDSELSTLLLVVADGSAARTDKAPASFHPGAEAFDARVVEVLAGGDPESLRTIDRAEALAVTAAGRPAWRVAATAMRGATYAGEVLVDEAPYGVGYVVARWRR